MSLPSYARVFVVAAAAGLTAAAGGAFLHASADPAAWPTFSADAIVEHVKVLSSDKFEGRAPGSHGEELTIEYLVGQFKALGLKPGNTDGTYIQNVPLVSMTANPATSLSFKKGATGQKLTYRDDFVAWTRRVADRVAVENSDMVFVGYGVTAPEFNWDDYKGTDLAGKTMVILVGDPPVPDPADASRLDPKTFGGRAMTYYGRWTYKYEIGAEKKAAAVLIVHETEPAGYPFSVVQGMGGEKFDLLTPDKNMGRAAVEGWISLDKARALFAMAGQDFDALKRQAATRAFKPVPLGVQASISIESSIRTVDSRNVVGKLEGSDPKLKDEYVIYTAHWDHFGIGVPVNGDRIYNGALDNASGTAALIEMARAFTKVQPAPKRSVLFVSVTGEEQGLLGSEYYATNPIYPLARTLAVINMDSMNIYGRTKDMTVVGLGNTDLDDYTAAAARELGREIKGDPAPERGGYYRSDHFPFAKQGVPALNAGGGSDFIGKPPDYAKQIREAYTSKHYHQPSDEYRPDWDLSGALEDLQVLFRVGYRVAGADRFPAWKPGTEFKAKRERMLSRTGTGSR
jgi:Zn-dependent M28 family amino/carboxypeptidase